MVSEIVMYQSMFVLGILMFGFFSVTFNDYEAFADATTLRSNLENVVEQVGQQIIDLISRGRSLQSTTSAYNISIDLILEAQYSNTPYTIIFDTTTNNMVMISALADGEIYANYTLGFVHGAANGEIEFLGTLSSSNANANLTYIYDSANLIQPAAAEQMIFG